MERAPREAWEVRNLEAGQGSALSVALVAGTLPAAAHASGAIVIWPRESFEEDPTGRSLGPCKLYMTERSDVWPSCLGPLATQSVCVGLSDGCAVQYDVEAERPAREYKGCNGHRDVISSVASCGCVLLTASHDGSVIAWDTREAEPLQSLRGHAGWVLCVTACGGEVISGGDDSTVRKYDLRVPTPSSSDVSSVFLVQTGSCLAVLDGDGGAVTGVVMCCGMVVGGESHGAVWCVDVESGSRAWRALASGGAVCGVACNGEHILSAHADGVVFGRAVMVFLLYPFHCSARHRQEETVVWKALSVKSLTGLASGVEGKFLTCDARGAVKVWGQPAPRGRDPLAELYS